jgi:hypothetical protein
MFHQATIMLAQREVRCMAVTTGTNVMAFRAIRCQRKEQRRLTGLSHDPKLGLNFAVYTQQSASRTAVAARHLRLF